MASPPTELQSAIETSIMEVDTEKRYSEATNLVREGKLEESLVLFLEVLRADPEYARAYADLGVALARLGRLAEAETVFRKAVRLDPSSSTACVNLATCLFDRKNSAEAVEWAREALRLKPDLDSAKKLLTACDDRQKSTLPQFTNLFGNAPLTLNPRDQRPFDVAVVMTTILRPTIRRAVESIFAQKFAGRIQILIGVDVPSGDTEILRGLATEAPSNCSIAVFDPGYSTSIRHGGLHPAADGGAIRTILSYAANSRLVNYLDDDNWWAPDHLATLVPAMEGRAWAYSLRHYVDAATAEPLCADRWESVGPDLGCYRDRFGGWVDPNCLMLDKIACEPALRLWSFPLLGDRVRMSADRNVFTDLKGRGAPGCSQRATVYYTMNPSDGMHPQRLRWIAESSADSTVAGTVAAVGSGS